MFGGGILLIIALAAVFWLFEVVRARMTKRPPPWKVPREPEPTPPLARALWGANWERPKLEPGERRERRRILWLVLLFYLVVAAVVAATVLTTRAAGGSDDAAIAAAILSAIACLMLVMVIGVTIELRKRR